MNKEDKNGFISLEIFNILGIRNTINHAWIEDAGRLYAIPNYLTNRRVNLKVGLNFFLAHAAAPVSCIPLLGLVLTGSVMA